MTDALLENSEFWYGIAQLVPQHIFEQNPPNTKKGKKRKRFEKKGNKNNSNNFSNKHGEQQHLNKKQRRELKKKEKKKLKAKGKKLVKRKNKEQSQNQQPTTGNSETQTNEDTGDKKISFGNYDLQDKDHGYKKTTKKKKQSDQALIRQLEKKQKKLGQMNEADKKKVIIDTEFKKAFARVQGKKIKDDVKLLKKSIKRKERKKKKSKEEWAFRNKKNSERKERKTRKTNFQFKAEV